MREHRAEIDGLRAVAVLSVIVFHAGFSAFPGGFVGVDVFFVISGYLITSILLKELAAGEFSVARFDERRARRILPALVVIVLVAIPFAWFLLAKHDWQSFLKSLISIAVFTANFHFWSNIDYFDSAAELKPFLHTWSLAVEEQYYIVAPLALLFVFQRLRPHMFSVFLVIGILSFAVAEYSSTRFPGAAFFLPHTRVWEFTVGGLVAIRVFEKGALAPNTILSLIGLAAICVPVLILSDKTPFPGLWALPPVLGTAAVILFGGTGSLTYRILALPPVAMIGLVSYSAYLWHQPIFAFARTLHPKGLSTESLVFLSILPLALGYLSWQFVERPFRNRRWLTRSQIFRLSAAALVGLVIMSFGLRSGVVDRYRTTFSGLSFARIAEMRARNVGLDAACDTVTDRPSCAHGEAPSAVLWGDSYAMHLAKAIAESETDLSFKQITKSACAPILGVAYFGGRYGTAWGRKCIAHNARVIDWLGKRPEIDTVIISSAFAVLGQKSSVLTVEGRILKRAGNHGQRRLEAMLDRLKEMGKRVVLVSPAPMSGFNIAACLTTASITNGDWDECNFPLGKRRSSRGRLLEQLGGAKAVPVVWLSDVLCPGGQCRSHAGGTMLFRDATHLSNDGAAYLGRTTDFAGRIRAALE